MKKLHPVLGSSVDPEKIAMTWKGIAVGLVPLFTIILATFGHDVTTTDITEVIEKLFSVVSAGMIAYGLIRKMIIKYSNT